MSKRREEYLRAAVVTGSLKQLDEALARGKRELVLRDRNGETVLMFAIRRAARASILHRLIDTGASVEAMSSAGQTPLMIAAVCGRTVALRTLVARGARVDRTNRKGESALTYAMTWNKGRAVEKLLELGASPDVPPPPAWSPLMYAAFEGSLRRSRLLVQAGAALRRVDGFGRSAADLAAGRGYRRLARFLAASRTRR